MGSLLRMQPYMVECVAYLFELLVASQALEHLISATSNGVYDTSLGVPLLVFGDLFLGHPLLRTSTALS